MTPTSDGRIRDSANSSAGGEASGMARVIEGPRGTLPMVLAFVFGVTFLATLLVLAVAVPNPTSAQFNIFRTVMALAGGGVAATIPGFLNLRVGGGQRFLIQAGGALAVFVLLYLFPPAGLVAEVHSGGNCSPNIVGNSGPVSANADCR